MGSGRRRRGVRPALVPAILALVGGLAALILVPPAPLVALRERVFDAALPAPAPVSAVLVVDIGELDEGGLPWGRGATARLMTVLAEAGASVVAMDIVYAGNCGDAGGFAGDNAALAEAIGRVPVVLGFLFTDAPTAPPVPRAALGLTADAGRRLWQVPGAEAPCPAFAAAAAGLGSVVLVGDGDGLVRRVAAAVLVAGQPYLPLAAEAVRLARGGAAPLIAASPEMRLRLGGATHGLDDAAQMRLSVSGPHVWAARTLSARDVLEGRGLERIAGAVVFVGSSLPRRGGLRATSASPVTPSVQVQADLASALIAEALPHRPARAQHWEAGFVAGMGLLVLALVPWVPAVTALGISAVAAGAWAGTGLWLLRQGVLVDPLFPTLAALGVALAALVAGAAATARAERALRLRMGQLLPPAVVSRLAESPGLLRLKGEAREVTSLFADIEGFSGMTHRLGPEALVAVLDRYFTLTGAIVLRHGGMIDKIVGDSIHALFNAPLDQPGHVDAALACAAEIRATTEALRWEPAMAAAGLGATRIGIETGRAVLGDVGSGARIDYTAYGDVVNLAARLQDVNKELGTKVCIGPGAAAAAKAPLRPLGEVNVRSFGRVAVFTLPDQSPTLA